MLRKIIALVLFGLGPSLLVFGAVPEIDPGSGANAIALLVGTILLIRHRTSQR